MEVTAPVIVAVLVTMSALSNASTSAFAETLRLVMLTLATPSRYTAPAVTVTASPLPGTAAQLQLATFDHVSSPPPLVKSHAAACTCEKAPLPRSKARDAHPPTTNERRRMF